MPFYRSAIQSNKSLTFIASAITWVGAWEENSEPEWEESIQLPASVAI